MVIHGRRPPIPWVCVFLALAGMAYCALQASPLHDVIPCASSGCTVFRNFAVWGVSLWWVGCAAFTVLALLCFRRQRALALFLAGTGLFIDSVLLVLMLVTAPCLSCLGAAFFLGAIYIGLRRPVGDAYRSTGGPSLLFLFWLVLFCAASFAALNEEMGSWNLPGSPYAQDRRVYFSPSCPACRDAVAAFGDSALYYPVAENDEDVPVIAAMHRALVSGATVREALEFGRANPVTAMSLQERVLLHLRLWRNKGDMLRQGFTKLPLLLINGMPPSMMVKQGAGQDSGLPPRQGQPGQSSSAQGTPALPGLENLGQCKEGPEPCAP